MVREIVSRERFVEIILHRYELKMTGEENFIKKNTGESV